VQVEDSGVTSFALQCRHCDDAPCVEACMTGAMHRDPETGAVVSDPERCVGCWMCVMVCPAGAVYRGTDEKIASKCDLCGGDLVPACVAGCPNEAVVYEDRSQDKEVDDDR
jgi:carbon-monoxide dehydrogenase iron sulfur subunit